MDEGQTSWFRRWWGVGLVAVVVMVALLGFGYGVRQASSPGGWLKLNFLGRQLAEEAGEPEVGEAGQPPNLKVDYLPEFEFESRLPGIEVQPGPAAQQLILSLLKRYGYPEPLQFGAFLPEGYQKLQPAVIKLVFAPINDLGSAEREQLIFKLVSVDEVRLGIKAEGDGRELTYLLYSDTNLLGQEETEIASSLTYQVLRAVFAAKTERSEPTELKQLWAEVRQTQTWVVQVKRQSTWQKLIRWVGRKLAPEVAAVSCQGVVECGMLQDVCVCDGSLSACDTEGRPCDRVGEWGTCTCQYGCYQAWCGHCGADPNVNCAQPNQAACLSVECSQPPPYCTYETCRWGELGPTPGGGGPPPGCTNTDIHACMQGDCLWNLRLFSRSCNGQAEYWCSQKATIPCTCEQQNGLRREEFEGDYPAWADSWYVLNRLKSITYDTNGINQNFGCDGCVHYERFGSKLGDHPDDSYGRGYIEIPATGSYTFYLSYSDGARLYIWDPAISGYAVSFADWSPCWSCTSAPRQSGPLTATLSQGYYPIRIDHWYDDNLLSPHSHNSDIKLEWEGPGIARQVIPATNFWSCYAPAASVPVCTGLEVPACFDVDSNFSVGAIGVTNASTVMFPVQGVSQGGTWDWLSGVDVGGGEWRATGDQANYPDESMNVTSYMNGADGSWVNCGGTLTVPLCPTPTPTPTPAPITVSGNVYRYAGTDACASSWYTSQHSGSTSLGGVSGLTVTNNIPNASTNSSAVNSTTGAYSFTVAYPGSYSGSRTITLNGASVAGFGNYCPSSGARSISLAGSNITSHFYIAEWADAWWQTDSGDAMAATTLSSRVPVATNGVNNPNPYLSLNSKVTVGGEAAGMGISGGLGSIAPATQVGADGAGYLIQGMYYMSPRENFAYFRKILKLPVEAEWLDPNNDNDRFYPSGKKPTTAAGTVSGETGLYVYKGGLDMGVAWSVGATEKIVVLVDGDVNINANVTVAANGFLMIVASGDINIAPTVTNVAGVYVTSGDLIVRGGSSQFVGQGVFVGWGGVSMDRDLEVDNATIPAEKWVYRPDIVMAAPDYLRVPDYTWKETAPWVPAGTYQATPTPGPSPTPTPTLVPTPTPTPAPCPQNGGSIICIPASYCQVMGGMVDVGYYCSGGNVCCFLN